MSSCSLFAPAYSVSLRRALSSTKTRSRVSFGKCVNCPGAGSILAPWFRLSPLCLLHHPPALFCPHPHTIHGSAFLHSAHRVIPLSSPSHFPSLSLSLSLIKRLVLEWLLLSFCLAFVVSRVCRLNVRQRDSLVVTCGKIETAESKEGKKVESKVVRG